MPPIETPLRRAARELIFHIPGAFLRADRGEALYVSDAPRRGARALVSSFDRIGFDAHENEGLLYLSPRVEWMARVTEELYKPEFEDEQMRLLKRLEKREIADFERKLWLDAIKFAEGTFVPAGMLNRRVREAAAVCLRTGRGGGSLMHVYLLYRAGNVETEE